MPILVDTGAAELLRRRDRRAEALAIRHYPPVLCTHVVGEFLFGQAHAKVSAAASQEARKFLDSFELLRPTACFKFAIKISRIGRKVGACLQAIHVAAHRLQAGSYPSLSSQLECKLD